jgi:biofilm protein TabA
MIIAEIRCAGQYMHVHPKFPAAIEFLTRQDLATIPPGRVDIDGNVLYAVVTAQQGKSATEAKLEAHRRYIDIHYVVSGIDAIGWRPTSQCSLVEDPFDVEKDFGLFRDEPLVWIPVHAGTFAVFFPEDAHAPMVSSGLVHKLVVKVEL